MGNKFCSCELCFNDNIETNLGNIPSSKTTIQKSPNVNNNSKASFTNTTNALKRNSSSSTYCQDTLSIDKKVREITVKNQASKIANCYKRHSLKKEKEKASPQLNQYELKTSNDNLNPIVNIGSSISFSIAHKENIDEQLKKNTVEQPNNNPGFIYGDDCSFKGSVTDLSKNDLHFIENKREASNEENHRYSIMKNQDIKEKDNENKNNGEKITNDDVMQLMGMFGKDDNTNNNCDDNNSNLNNNYQRFDSDNDNLSFE